MQLTLDLIRHQVGKEIIQQRAKDGYINATAMCKAAGRPWSRYWEAKPSKEFASALSADLGISITELIQSLTGGYSHLQGTWVHPQVAIHLAQWLTAEFAVQVTKWVFEWMSDATPVKHEVPYHLRRYIANQHNVPAGHFSVLSELTLGLIGPLEAQGYTIPERLMPDISMGRMFCKWLREKHGIDTNQLPTYKHVYEDGRIVDAKAYPENLLADFRKHFREEWLMFKAVKYFKERDPEALTYLPKLLPTRH